MEEKNKFVVEWPGEERDIVEKEIMAFCINQASLKRVSTKQKKW